MPNQSWDIFVVVAAIPFINQSSDASDYTMYSGSGNAGEEPLY